MDYIHELRKLTLTNRLKGLRLFIPLAAAATAQLNCPLMNWRSIPALSHGLMSVKTGRFEMMSRFDTHRQKM